MGGARGKKDTASFLCSPANQEWGAESGISDRSLPRQGDVSNAKKSLPEGELPCELSLWGAQSSQNGQQWPETSKTDGWERNRHVTSFRRATTKNLNQGQEGRIIKKKLVWWGLWGACVPSEEQLCSELANSCHQGMWAQGCLLFHFWGLFFICVARNLYFCLKSSDL